MLSVEAIRDLACQEAEVYLRHNLVLKTFDKDIADCVKKNIY